MRLGGLDHDIIVDESTVGRASSALLDRKHPAYKPLSTGIDQNSGGATEGHDQRHTFMVYIRRAVDYVSDRYNHQNISHGASFEHFSLARAWAAARQGGGGEGCNGGGAMRALLRGKVFQS